MVSQSEKSDIRTNDAETTFQPLLKVRAKLSGASTIRKAIQPAAAAATATATQRTVTFGDGLW